MPMEWKKFRGKSAIVAIVHGRRGPVNREELYPMYQVIQKDPALVLQGPQGLLRLYPVNENATDRA